MELNRNLCFCILNSQPYSFVDSRRHGTNRTFPRVAPHVVRAVQLQC